MHIVGAMFLLAGVCLLRGFWRAVIASLLSLVAYGFFGWWGVYPVLIAMIILGTREPKMVDTAQARDRRRTLLESQDKAARDLFDGGGGA